MRRLTVIGLSIALFSLSVPVGYADQEQTYDGGKWEEFQRTKAKNKERLRKYRLSRDHAAAETTSAKCAGGVAGQYPCRDIDLAAHLSLEDFDVLTELAGGDILFFNDIWGYTDKKSRREYALLGSDRGTIAVDVTNADTPIITGILPTVRYDPSGGDWRDIKVRGDHAFIVSEIPRTGMQVWDLTSLSKADTSNGPVRFESLAVYEGFSRAHNIYVNVDTGFAYAVGTNTCLGGMEMIDISNPAKPTDAGCYKEDGYIHDTQCVIYKGPDKRYRDREICINSAGELFAAFIDPEASSISVIDVTDKENVEIITEFSYKDLTGTKRYRGYSHQGWLTPDHSIFLHDDEFDEEQGSVAETTTRIWDFSDLQNPVLIAQKTNGQTSSDHNLYIRGKYSFHSNYTSGLRIFDSSNAANSELPEIAYFDIFPANDDPVFKGTWSNYPYFQYKARNIVAVSSIEDGLFLLRPRITIPRGGNSQTLASSE